MLRLTRAEYARFMAVVNTYYYNRFQKKKFCTILLDNKYIVFEIKEFCTYTIMEVGVTDENSN